MMPLKSARITYPYGVKNSRYGKGYHTGIDLAASEYSIYAAVPGMIIESRYAPGKGADPSGWGNYVILRTNDGKHDIIHAHLSSIAVIKGQSVVEGTKLGVMGSTGASTGPHLHFEVRSAPWPNKNDIDPSVFLGIKNAVGAVESLPVESEVKRKMKNLVLCDRGPDHRAAGYLADHLHAPVDFIDSVSEDTLNAAENIYVVGGSKKPCDKAVLISGTDRYDTCRKVLDICQGK